MVVEVQQAELIPDVDLTFTKADLQDVVPHDNNPVVISLVIAGRRVHRVLMDQEGSADVMFLTTFNQLQLSTDQLRPYTGCLYGFAGDGVSSCTASIRYLVVNALSAYNILLGRPTFNRLGAVPSTRHMMVKLPSLDGAVSTINSN
ncbi:uncharacterized protein [Phaseolus vulgaris]|uniref:uncharacterized protein n=1 Tax=Phaseolus vulgaris TaxID=3885 RepID=UPI0035CAAA04